jgi:nucleotide-binding universal stress UspA family protein
VVANGRIEMIRRILHASDFSSASRPAFAKAVDLARANRAELIVTHVLVPAMPVMVDGYISPRAYAEIEAAARREVRKRLALLVTKAARAGVRARALLLEGIPADRIVRAATSQRADLVVIGTHGRTGWSRLVLGSVASRVIGRARCPVLTVRGR